LKTGLRAVERVKNPIPPSHEINIFAFGGKNGAKLVEKLWKSPSFDAELSI
jgi:hypothetical protein